MMEAFEVNAVGPLLMMKALMPYMNNPAKVALLSTGMGSIGDNGSGGIYAYRASKAAMNMVARTMAMDFKKMENGIAVQAIAPGTVVTDFGMGQEAMAKMGKPVEGPV